MEALRSNELRIGNLVLFNTKPSKVCQIDDDNFTVEDGSLYCGNEYCNPIPITEEWLVRFGLKHEKWSLDNIRLNKDVSVGYIDDDFVKDVMSFRYKTVIIKIQYVHQLQNLYFALTGEELKLN